VEIRTTFTR